MIAFAAHPQTPDAYIPYFLSDFMAFAQTNSLDRILLRVPVYSSRLYKLLPANQYRVVGSDLRMTLEGFAEKPDVASLHINRWV